MKNVLATVNRKSSVGGAAFLISALYLISRILGLLRDRLLASHFGVGPLVDAYTAAFRLPDLLFALLVSGAVGVAFMPVINRHLQNGEQTEAWRVSSSLLNLLAFGTLAASTIAFIFADPVTKLITPSFDPYRHQLTVNLTRIMLITPVLFSISSVLGSLQQTFNRFFFNASAGVVYNLGIILGIIFLGDRYSIYGVAIGVAVGAALQALIQILGLAGLGFRYRPNFNWRHKSVKKIFALMVPRSIDQGVGQLNYTVQTIIGSQLATGSLAAYYFANNLKNVPLVIFGTAIATAAFPKMAADAAAGKRDKLIEDFVVNLRLILFLTIPSATVAVLMRGYIVRLLFGFGNSTTASVLGWFAGIIIFESIFFLTARVFYSLQDTKTPLYLSLAAISLNVVLSILLANLFGVTGLAMAQTTAIIIQSLTLLVLLRLRLGSIGLRSIISGVYRMLLANAIMASLIYILVARILPLYQLDRGFMVVGPKFAAIIAIGFAAYLIPCYLLQLDEAKSILRKVFIRLPFLKTLN